MRYSGEVLRLREQAGTGREGMAVPCNNMAASAQMLGDISAARLGYERARSHLEVGKTWHDATSNLVSRNLHMLETWHITYIGASNLHEKRPMTALDWDGKASGADLRGNNTKMTATARDRRQPAPWDQKYVDYFEKKKAKAKARKLAGPAP